MIRRNLVYKLLAIVVALVLWTYVNAERSPQAARTFTVPVTARGLPKGFVAELGSDDASITVQGLKSVVDSIRKEDIRAWVDLNVNVKKEVAEKTLALSTRVLGVPENELNVIANPRTVNVTIEALSGKRLPVEVKFASAPPVGYAYSDPVITPNSVRVSGKSVSVARVNRVIVSLADQAPTGPVDDYFDVTALDSGGNIVKDVKLDPGKVRLKLELQEVPATKAVMVSSNISGEPKYPARVTRVSVTPSSVILQGKPSALVGVSTIMTDRISIEGADSTVTRDTTLRPPPGVEVVGKQTVRVTVYIGAPEQPSGGQ